MIVAHNGPIVRGELRKLFDDLENWKGRREVLEVLVEGARGSAKSRNVITFLYRIARRYRDLRILVVRKTRASLTDSFCDTFENEVLPPDIREYVIGRGDRSGRTHYELPNRSRFVLVGLDKPSKYQSTNVDIVFCEEASELAWKSVEPFFGALRRFGGGIPWQLFIAATNPDGPRHWLNVRAGAGKMRRVLTHHTDNPKFYTKSGQQTPEGAAFMQSLERYTGVSRDRHVLGLWRGAEGAVWENYDERIHLVEPIEDWRAGFGIIECRAAIDWGFADTGALGVWGIDTHKRGVCLERIYRSKRNLDWWAGRFVELVKTYQITRAVADPSRQDAIDLFNDWLVKAGLPRIVYGADNKRASTPGGDLAGLDLVRWGFERDAHGVPRIRFVNKAPYTGVDEELVADGKPYLGYDEIPEYTFARDALGEIIGDRTDPACRDDFADSVRYWASDNWPSTPRPIPIPETVYPPGSYGAMYGTPESLLKERLRRENDD